MEPISFAVESALKYFNTVFVVVGAGEYGLGFTKSVFQSAPLHETT